MKVLTRRELEGNLDECMILMNNTVIIRIKKYKIISENPFEADDGLNKAENMGKTQNFQLVIQHPPDVNILPYRTLSQLIRLEHKLGGYSSFRDEPNLFSLLEETNEQRERYV